MKLFIISDIHGSEYYLKKTMTHFDNGDYDYIIVLGDILYHGPRNPLTKGYNPQGVLEILNEYSDKIIAVRGNCDSEVDEMVLDFPIMSTYSNLLVDNRRIFLTHGHVYHEDNMVDLVSGSVVMSGHTHILKAELKDGIYFVNPGSISLPKGGHPCTYAVLDHDTFYINDLDGNTVQEISFV